MVHFRQSIHRRVDEIELHCMGHLVQKHTIHQTFETQSTLHVVGAPNRRQTHHEETRVRMTCDWCGERDDPERDRAPVWQSDCRAMYRTLPSGTLLRRLRDVLAAIVEYFDGREWFWGKVQLTYLREP